EFAPGHGVYQLHDVHTVEHGHHRAVGREDNPQGRLSGVLAGKAEPLPPGAHFPEAVFRDGADYEPSAVRAEGGQGALRLRLAEVERVYRLPRLGGPDLGPLAVPVPA